MNKLNLTGATVFGVALNDKNTLTQWTPQFLHDPYRQLPKKPVLFIKTPNTYNEQHKVVFPEGLTLQPGPCVAVVFAKDASRVKADAALQYVAGLVAANEYSLPEESYYRPAVRAKCRDGFLTFSDDVIPLSAIEDPNSLRIELRINGVLRQSGNSADWLRDIPTLIEEISDFMTLHAGDVLLMGVPNGRENVAIGDKVEVTVDGIGSVHDVIISR